MANQVSHTLVAYGSKQEIQRFVDTFTENFAEDRLCVTYFIPEEKQEKKCRYWFRTPRNPRLYEVTEIQGMFPKLFFKHTYSDYMCNYKGCVISKGDRVLSYKEGAMFSQEESYRIFGGTEDETSQEPTN